MNEEIHFHGCNAGDTVMGIEADGTIKSCPGLPSPYAGGNIRERRLRDIWENAEPMAFNRRRTVEDLWGYCRSCYYAETCLAGCTWTAHALMGRAGNNPMCHHRALDFEARGCRERLVKVKDAEEILRPWRIRDRGGGRRSGSGARQWLSPADPRPAAAVPGMPSFRADRERAVRFLRGDLAALETAHMESAAEIRAATAALRAAHGGGERQLTPASRAARRGFLYGSSPAARLTASSSQSRKARTLAMLRLCSG